MWCEEIHWFGFWTVIDHLWLFAFRKAEVECYSYE